MTKKLILIPLALIALAVPAVAAKPDQKLSIEAHPKVVTFGQTLTITGKLTGGTQRDISGQDITVLRDEFPYEGRFERVGTAETTDTGAYNVSVPPGANTKNAKYRATARGGVDSPDITVPVRVAVTRRVSDKTPTSGQRVKFSGTVAPAHDGKVARIQRRTDTGWKTVAKVTLADAGEVVSKYSKRVRITRSGRYRVRFNPADGDHAAGNSRRVRITVE